MTIENAQPQRRAGKRGLKRESHQPELLITNFDREAFDSTYAEWDGSDGITEWGMDANDELGDCGPAATDHGNMAKANDAGLLNSLGKPKYDGTVPTYYAYGVAMGEGPDADEGVDNASWLAFLYKNGIIDGYAEVPLNMLDRYAPQGNGLLVGQLLDDDAEQDFEATPPIPWGTNSTEQPDPDDGHDTWLIKLHADGSGTMITWAGLQEFLVNYREKNLTDAWIILDEDDAKRLGLDWDAIKAVLTALHGTVDNVTPPGDTPPTPSPQPAPAPQPVPVDPPAPAPAPTPPAPAVEPPEPETLEQWVLRLLKEIEDGIATAAKVATTFEQRLDLLSLCHEHVQLVADLKIDPSTIG